MKEIKKIDYSVLNFLIKKDDELNKIGKHVTKDFISKSFPNMGSKLIEAYYNLCVHRENVIDIVDLDSKMLRLKSLNKDLKNKIELKNKNIELLENQIDFLYGISSTDEKPVKFINIEKSNKNKNESTALTAISDIHFESEVVPSRVNYYNKYNPDIAKKRIEKLFKTFLDFVNIYRKQVVIKDCVVSFIGDLIQGHLRDEDLENNTLSPIEAANGLWPILAEGLKFLSEYGNFDSIIVPCVIGNHGRDTLKKHQGGLAYKHDYEYGMFHTIKKFLENHNNIEFIIPESIYATINVYGLNVRFSHGDHFRYNKGVGGISPGLLKWRDRQNKSIPADIVVIGHWHNYQLIENILINGSVIGFNELGMNWNFNPERPMQQFQLINSKYGISANHRMVLDDFYYK